MSNDEKKVEYIELIYDLIFVYLLGKNASLLDRIEAGFITPETFLNYIISSLIILQIWYYSTLYMNWFGRNSFRDKLSTLINMILLYFIGANTIHGWNMNYPVYMGAWSLILVNLAMQYLLHLRTTENSIWKKHILKNAAALLIQASYIIISILLYASTGHTIGQWAFLIGFMAMPFTTKIPTNFAHLTERVMLYVVFTFGDMLLIIAEYFTYGFTFETIFFAVTSVLIVAGLFFSYGYIYDHLLNRNGHRRCGLYMVLHIFIVLSLSCVTTALEFMHNNDVHSKPKVLMLLISILIFYIGLMMTEHWSIRMYQSSIKFHGIMFFAFMFFAAAVTLTEGISGYLTTGLILAFVYAQLAMILMYGQHTKQR